MANNWLTVFGHEFQNLKNRKNNQQKVKQWYSQSEP